MKKGEARVAKYDVALVEDNYSARVSRLAEIATGIYEYAVESAGRRYEDTGSHQVVSEAKAVKVAKTTAKAKEANDG